MTRKEPHARLLSVDTQHALSLPGVVGYVDHRDIAGENSIGCIVKDEAVFAKEEVSL